MLKTGDKIKYVKENPMIGIPLNTVLTVTEVNNTVIALEGQMNLIGFIPMGIVKCVMSYDEYEKYFEKVVEPETKPEAPKRVWTKWEVVGEAKDIPQCGDYGCTKSQCWYFNMCDYFGMDDIEYKTNGKKVMVRYKTKNGYIKSEATCHKEDTFNLLTGLKVAITRLTVKKAEYNAKNLIKEIG